MQQRITDNQTTARPPTTPSYCIKIQSLVRLGQRNEKGRHTEADGDTSNGSISSVVGRAVAAAIEDVVIN
jgi:hypothetical protein